MDLVLKENVKCKRSKLNNLEDYFEKVWNEIEKKNKNVDSSDLSEEEISSENDENKKINYDIPNSININENLIKDNKKDSNLDLKEENGCGENICANICKMKMDVEKIFVLIYVKFSKYYYFYFIFFLII